MATYILLVNWTDRGIKAYKDTTTRADAFAGALEKFGSKLASIYWTVGLYDLVGVVEAPDDETVTAALLQLGSTGNVRTTTLRAFGRAEIERILAKAQS